MRIVCAGGGPGGLYAALLLKKADPTRDITVIDRNPPNATYGWGVVFSDETLGFLRESDAESYDAIERQFVHWEAIDIHYRDQVIRSGGHAFSGLARRRLLNILQDRCRELGVVLRLESELTEPSSDVDADLIIASDGVNSRIRTEGAAVFKPTFDVHPTKFIWMGTTLRLDAFTFVFIRTEWGMFQAHAYRFDHDRSTFIVECNEDVWRRSGLDRVTEAESICFCQDLFADVLHGELLLSNRSTWLNFVTLRNETWSVKNVVLLGDSAHTAHFSIGSGTKIAMEDAIALTNALGAHSDIRSALVEYEELRQPAVDRIQQAARDSSLWFEHVERYAGLDPVQFGFSLLTRSKRITYENLRLRDAGFAEQVDDWCRRAAGAPVASGSALAPLANPLKLRELVLPNRLAVAPDGGCTAIDGVLGDAHLAELRETAGVELVLTEPVAVSADGRITSATAGLYTEAGADAWLRALEAFRVSDAAAAVGVRLSHAGPRGSTRPHSEGVDLPLEGGGWPLLAASPVAYSPYAATPRGMQPADLDRVREEFAIATLRAAEAGFDLLELDFSHGYLLATFLSPLTNRRLDEYGGDLAGRLRYPLEILDAVRALWPAGRPLSVAFSVTDWVKGGIALEESVSIATAFRKHGCDLLHVVSGQTTFRANPVYGRAWESAYGDAIRNEARMPVLLGGNITSDDEVNTLVAAGRADLCLVAP